MKTATVGLLAVAMIFLVGCKDRASVKTEEKGLTLVAPGDVKIARGGTADITVKVERTNFSDAVKIHFANLPKGVKVIGAGGVDVDAGPVHVDIGHEPPAITGEKATYKLQADADAPLVEGTSTQVTADGPDGKKVTASFKITVVEAE